MLALDVLGLMPTQAPVALGVLAVTALFAFDPGSDGADLDEFVDDASATESATPNANANGAVADGGDDADPADYDALVDDANETDDDSEPGYGYPGEEESRAPWL